jgi:hypothetical protein
VGKFRGVPAGGRPELDRAAALTGDVAREAAQRAERENPGWIVLFGVFTKEFVCFPRFPAPAGTIVTSHYPDAILQRMRMIERALRAGLLEDETT